MDVPETERVGRCEETKAKARRLHFSATRSRRRGGSFRGLGTQGVVELTYRISSENPTHWHVA
ncbi:MAG: hypothetical protein ABJA98_10385 [Acidobacteriota bacterium]